MKNPVIASPSFVITIIVYSLLSPIFFELDYNVYEEETTTNFVVDNSLYTHQQIVEKECKSACPPNAEEMCIQMCA